MIEPSIALINLPVITLLIFEDVYSFGQCPSLSINNKQSWDGHQVNQKKLIKISNQVDQAYKTIYVSLRNNTMEINHAGIGESLDLVGTFLVDHL